MKQQRRARRDEQESSNDTEPALFHRLLRWRDASRFRAPARGGAALACMQLAESFGDGQNRSIAREACSTDSFRGAPSIWPAAAPKNVCGSVTRLHRNGDTAKPPPA